MKTYDLKTAYMRNPMGLDDLHPQLSWKTKDGKKQTAFKIEVSVNDKPWKLMEERRSDSMKTSYSLPLESRDRILWRAAVADENGVYDSWRKRSGKHRLSWETMNIVKVPKCDIRWTVLKRLFE